MDFRILGSLEVVRDRRTITIGGARQQAVLAILLLQRGQVVSVDRMVDKIWGERPARVGCQFEHPIYGIDLAALCLRAR